MARCGRRTRRRLRMETVEPRLAMASLTWTEQTPLSTSHHIGPSSLQMADLDQDGDLDMLVASQRDGRVGWYENRSRDGQVMIHHVIADGLASADFVLAADFENDGDLDLAVLSRYDNTIRWLEHVDGRGTFSPPQLVTDEAIAGSSLAAADLDGDGDLDLISTSSGVYDSDLSWYENLGSGAETRFSRQRVISAAVQSPQSLVTADLDTDGDLDLAIANTGTNEVVWFENLNGRGQFGEERFVASLPGVSTLVAGDLDGDGDIDLISASGYYGFNEVSWYENLNGQGTFSAARTVSNLPGVNVMRAVDMDGDRDLDLLMSSAARSTTVWFENRGQGLFRPTENVIPIQFAPTSLATSDINGDGDLEVAFVSNYWDVVGWVERGTNGAWTTKIVSEIGADGVTSLDSADLDSDGDLDVVATSSVDSRVIWFENLGNGQFGPLTIIEADLSGPQNVEIVDFNRDGRPDLLVSAARSSTVVWYENLGATAAGASVTFSRRRTISSRLSSVSHVRSADFDSDGDMDVVAASNDFFSPRVVWFKNVDGLGNFSGPTTIPTRSFFPSRLAIGDLNGDQHLDLVVISNQDSQVEWFANTNGLGTWSASVSLPEIPRFAATVELGDLDGDGDLDVAVSSTFENVFKWYRNDGQGIFSAATAVTVSLSTPSTFRIFDLDQDGDQDVVAASLLGEALYWLENTDGAGQLAEPQRIAVRLNNPMSLEIADFDGDGDLDVVSASYSDSRIAWFRNGVTVQGDVNEDGAATVADIELWCQAYLAGVNDARLDRNRDTAINLSDFEFLVSSEMKVARGDVNLDGVFNSRDLVQIFQAGFYESPLDGLASWSTGDWNCDARFSSSDLILALQKSQYSVE